MSGHLPRRTAFLACLPFVSECLVFCCCETASVYDRDVPSVQQLSTSDTALHDDELRLFLTACFKDDDTMVGKKLVALGCERCARYKNIQVRVQCIDACIS